jgi:class 3 adenylate cyclase
VTLCFEPPGEVEISNGDIRGIAVHITSRVADLGSTDDIVVSRTIRDLVAGSGISFDDFGTHTLKGVPDAWQLYRVAHPAGAVIAVQSKASHSNFEVPITGGVGTFS